jgi:thiamine pyrophosphokinase
MSTIAVILANGNFPVHEIPLGYLKSTEHLICCDGSAENLIKAGMEPEAIVGDLDSLKPELKERFSDRLYQDGDQDTNDLTKAVKWCKGKGYGEIVILGATGKREDHAIGNISLLIEYSKEIKVIMVTDTGKITPFLKSCIVTGFPGQQVSIFSIDPESEITSSGLKYELRDLKLKNWWTATLNELIGESFTLTFTRGQVLVYQKFRD